MSKSKRCIGTKSASDKDIEWPQRGGRRVKSVFGFCYFQWYERS